MLIIWVFSVFSINHEKSSRAVGLLRNRDKDAGFLFPGPGPVWGEHVVSVHV